MEKEIIIENLNKICSALDTISVSGYRDCKTYTNCIEALQTIKEQVSNLEIKEKNTEGD